MGTKKEVETAIEEARLAKDSDDLDDVKAKSEALSQASMKMGSKIYGQQKQEGGDETPRRRRPTGRRRTRRRTITRWTPSSTRRRATTRTPRRRRNKARRPRAERPSPLPWKDGKNVVDIWSTRVSATLDATTG